MKGAIQKVHKATIGTLKSLSRLHAMKIGFQAANVTRNVALTSYYGRHRALSTVEASPQSTDVNSLLLLCAGPLLVEPHKTELTVSQSTAIGLSDREPEIRGTSTHRTSDRRHKGSSFPVIFLC